MKLTDGEIFEFIFERLVEVHGENRNLDYMRRFRDAIEQANENRYRIESMEN